MLNVNGRILCNASHNDTTWPRKPELKIREVFNWQIFDKREVLMKVICWLSKKRSRDTNKLKDERENSLKSELRYQFVIKSYQIQKKLFLLFIFLLLSPIYTSSLLSQDVVFFNYSQVLYHLFCHFPYFPVTMEYI